VLNTNRIRIEDGEHSKGFKELVSIIIMDYLEEKCGNHSWYSGDINRDVNAVALAEYLDYKFPESSPWKTNGSQQRFDIYSLTANVAVEIKSQRGTKNGSQRFITGNATIYPPEAKILDIVSKNKWDPEWPAGHEEIKLDVLVVIVEKHYKTGIVNNFCIVDGSYWGITYAHYTGLKKLFSQLNTKSIKTFLFEKMRVESNMDPELISMFVEEDYVAFYIRTLLKPINPLYHCNQFKKYSPQTLLFKQNEQGKLSL